MVGGKVYAYCRASTVKQDLLQQENAVLRYAQKNGLLIYKMQSETCSGAVAPKDRVLGLSVLPVLKQGDTLLITELSRLSRDTLTAMKIVSDLIERNITVILTNYALTLTNDITGKIYLTVFSLVADLERNAISERTKQALASARAMGKKLGRPKGSHGKSKLDGHEVEIKSFLEKKVSKASICKIWGVSYTCLNHFIQTRL